MVFDEMICKFFIKFNLDVDIFVLLIKNCYSNLDCFVFSCWQKMFLVKQKRG